MLSFECRAGGSFDFSGVSLDEEESRGFGEETRGGGDFARGFGEEDLGGSGGSNFGEAGDDDLGSPAGDGGKFGDVTLGVEENKLSEAGEGPESSPMKASSNVGLGGSVLRTGSVETLGIEGSP